MITIICIKHQYEEKMNEEDQHKKRWQCVFGLTEVWMILSMNNYNNIYKAAVCRRREDKHKRGAFGLTEVMMILSISTSLMVSARLEAFSSSRRSCVSRKSMPVTYNWLAMIEYGSIFTVISVCVRMYNILLPQPTGERRKQKINASVTCNWRVLCENVRICWLCE